MIDVYRIRNEIKEHVPKEFSMGKLVGMGFFRAPASTKFHGNYEGGLAEHCYNTAIKLAEISAPWVREESPWIIGILHDICKCDQYEKLDGVWRYKEKTLLKGHGDKSVMLANQIIQLTEEEMLCIRYHMGAYQQEDWDGFDQAIRKYENVLWTHTADMYASKVLGV